MSVKHKRNHPPSIATAGPALGPSRSCGSWQLLGVCTHPTSNMPSDAPYEGWHLTCCNYCIHLPCGAEPGVNETINTSHMAIVTASSSNMQEIPMLQTGHLRVRVKVAAQLNRNQQTFMLPCPLRSCHGTAGFAGIPKGRQAPVQCVRRRRLEPESEPPGDEARQVIVGRNFLSVSSSSATEVCMAASATPTHYSRIGRNLDLEACSMSTFHL